MFCVWHRFCCVFRKHHLLDFISQRSKNNVVTLPWHNGRTENFKKHRWPRSFKRSGRSRGDTEFEGANPDVTFEIVHMAQWSVCIILLFNRVVERMVSEAKKKLGQQELAEKFHVRSRHTTSEWLRRRSRGPEHFSRWCHRHKSPEETDDDLPTFSEKLFSWRPLLTRGPASVTRSKNFSSCLCRRSETVKKRSECSANYRGRDG